MPLPKDFVDPEPLTARRQWGKSYVSATGEQLIERYCESGYTQLDAEIITLGQGALSLALSQRPEGRVDVADLIDHVSHYLPDGIAITVDARGICLNGDVLVYPVKWLETAMLTKQATAAVLKQLIVGGPA